jgi:ABC-type branched-subunit amino acid transport system permease subunit
LGFAASWRLPIGFISLRTSGVYFIMITLAFAQMIYYFAISWPALRRRRRAVARACATVFPA